MCIFVENSHTGKKKIVLEIPFFMV